MSLRRKHRDLTVKPCHVEIFHQSVVLDLEKTIFWSNWDHVWEPYLRALRMPAFRASAVRKKDFWIFCFMLHTWWDICFMYVCMYSVPCILVDVPPFLLLDANLPHTSIFPVESNIYQEWYDHLLRCRCIIQLCKAACSISWYILNNAISPMPPCTVIHKLFLLYSYIKYKAWKIPSPKPERFVAVPVDLFSRVIRSYSRGGMGSGFSCLS